MEKHFLTPLFDPTHILVYAEPSYAQVEVITSDATQSDDAALVGATLVEENVEFSQDAVAAEHIENTALTRWLLSTLATTEVAQTLVDCATLDKTHATSAAPSMPTAAGEGLACISCSGEYVLAALNDAVQRGCAAVIMFSRARNGLEMPNVIAYARALRLRLLGAGSIGIARPHRKLNVGIATSLQRVGNLALVSQSSALTAAMVDWAEAHTVGFSAVASSGKLGDIRLAEILDFYAHDAHTQSIVVYMEGVGHSRSFMSALRAATRIKPVIVLKAGRRFYGQNALNDETVALTHAGAIIGADDVFDAALKRAGAVRVDSFVQLFSAVKCLASRFKPVGNRLGIVSNGSGPALLAADYALLRGVAIANLQEGSLAAIGHALPLVSITQNPIILGDNATAHQYTIAVQTLARDVNVDGILVIVSPLPGTAIANIAAAALHGLPGIQKPVMACWMGETRVAATRRAIEEANLPVFRLPEAAVDAFANIAAFYANQQLLMQTAPPYKNAQQDGAPDIETAKQIITTALAEGRTLLSDVEAKRLLAAFHIPVARTEIARSAEAAVELAAAIAYPVAMKINSPDITHKTDVAGVVLNLKNAAQVHAMFNDLLAEVAVRAPTARLDGVILQPMVAKRHGREIYVGMVRDQLFGPVVSFGAGGTMVEMFDDRTVELPPINSFIAKKMIARSRIGAQLGTWRGMAACKVDELETILLRVSEMLCALPWLRELDINPIIIDEHGAAVVDARVVVAETQQRQPFDHMAILPYPAELETKVCLKNGLFSAFRAIRPEDAFGLQEFVRSLSEQSRYFRFVGAMHELPPRLLARFTQIDYDREMAIVAALENDDSKIIGVARYMLNPDAKSCEFGLVVADEFQGQGVGGSLMQRLMEIAKSRGLSLMEGIVLANNSGMLRLVARLGFSNIVDPDDPEMRLVRRDLLV
jgi:acetyltransferase